MNGNHNKKNLEIFSTQFLIDLHRLEKKLNFDLFVNANRYVMFVLRFYVID